MRQHGHFNWNELMTRDPDAAKMFYSDLLGWTFDGMRDEVDGGTYWICKDGDQFVGGIFDMNKPAFDGMPAHWGSYVAVNDIDASVTKASIAGATIKRPPFDVPGVGRIAMIQDPTGAVLGWMTPSGPAK